MPDTPIFDFTETFPADIGIGDKTLPVHVKRMNRGEWRDFIKGWKAVELPRGAAEMTNEERESRDLAQLEYFDGVISEHITVDTGLVRNNGEWVTTGSGLVEVFHNRLDVLSSLAAAVYIKNSLNEILRKNSNSPRASEAGSELSPSRGGDRQGSVASDAEPSSSASLAGATDVNDAAAMDVPSSSGTTRERADGNIH